MLYREDSDTFTLWQGEVINDIRYPLNIEVLWDSDELAAIGLYIPVFPSVPGDKVVVSSTVERIEDIVTFVYVLEDAPVVPLSLVQLACAQLTITDYDVAGLERCTGIAGAFMLDIDYLYVMLNEEQPDEDFIVTPADGVTKYTDHVEIQRPGLSIVSFIIQRVQ